MPKTFYTEEQRAEALALLRYNRSNVALTSQQTGIPERTLREWRRLQRIENVLPPAKELSAAAKNIEDAPEALEYVYKKFLKELVAIADSLPELVRTAPPYHQLLTMMKLLDRLELLHMLTTGTIDPTIQVEFVDMDGSTHPTPFWQRDNKGDPNLN